MTSHEKYMQRCLRLAEMGKGRTAPNPLVGSVIVHQGKIIGEGYHEYYGGPHAEVNAVQAVTDKSLLSEATLYVNLEPCAHHGKTPPCANLIIDHQIPRVVVGCVDTYSEVAGKGIARMMEKGVHVTVGILEEESREINQRFFTFHTHQRPYVILKWAQSQDGFMDIDRTAGEKGVHWITAPETKTLTHQWRHEEAGILVGRNTVATDNPSLTCRAYEGTHPTRIVIDQKMKLDYGAFAVGDRSVLTYILTEKSVISNGNLQFIQPKDFSIDSILTCLYELDIQSVIIEGGKQTLTHFIHSGKWDEARILTGAHNLESGIRGPKLQGKVISSYAFGNDHIKIMQPYV